MNKILSFIANEKKELLLLKGSPNDPQLKKSIWYVVTGGCEKIDKIKEETVKREVKEETNLEIKKMIYLNWILKYNSLGNDCIEYVYMSFVRNKNITLNEENIDYKWCDIDTFVDEIDWFGNKKVLKAVLNKALKNERLFKNEQIDEF